MTWLKNIDCVLLDMDGTLLDKYFDDYFWEHLVPEKYAEKKEITFGRAKEELLAKYKRHEGTLDWTDLDFWTRTLELDIPALKEQIKHLIEVHPHVEDFLTRLKRDGKEVHLLTNAHYKALEIKFRQTGIGKYFGHVLTSCSLGAPKESTRFWEKAQHMIGFDKQRTLFIDDSLPVLRTAREFGIKHVYLKERPSSRGPAARQKKEKNGKTSGFPSIHDFRELMA
jgi:putative hydrolase of the HAD superfamily